MGATEERRHPETGKVVTLATKLIEASETVASVKKRGKNTHQNYNYVMAEDVVAAATKALLPLGIFCDFEVRHTDLAHVTTAKGAPAILATVHGSIIATDAGTGETLTRKVVGSGHDQPGDKAVLKAMTSARKYGFMHLLGIPIGEDPEADAGTGQSRRQASAPKLDTAKARLLFEAIEERRAAGMTFDDLALLLGSAGVDAPEKRSVKSVQERLATLSDEQAAALEKELGK